MDAYSIFLENFKKFTDIQERAIPVVESGENCIITAPPGTGKTEAALLPILNRLHSDKTKQGVNVMYITPLRALNRDLFRRLKQLCSRLEISIEVRHGDTTPYERAKQARRPPNILITTPESLQNILLTKSLRNSLKNMKVVIVDELHELYYNKRGAQLSVALERLREVAGDFQRIGISATIGDVESAAHFLCKNKPRKIAESEIRKEIVVEVEMPRKPKKEYPEFSAKFNLDNDSVARIERIQSLIKDSKATLVFANTRQVVESLGNKLLYFDRIAPFGSIGVHHSSLDKDERIAIENSFKEGRIKSIIATSSLELGIDVGKIDLVIQYGSPRQVTRLVQRVGRSGHTEKEASKGKIIVANTIDALESAAIVWFAKRGNLEKRGIQNNAYDVLLNQLCATALEYGTFEAEFFYELVRRSANYENLTRGELNRLLTFANDQKLVKFDGGKVSLGSRTRSYNIENISVIPDVTKFLVKNVLSNKLISTLDESFVYNNVEEGSTFVTKGLVWRVVSIEENVVFVEPSTEIEAAIPDWEGEDIPVSRQVAELAFSLFDQKKFAIVRETLDNDAHDEALRIIEEQRKYFEIKEGNLMIEELENRTIVYTALGKLGNDLLAKILGILASANVGERVVARSTAYAVVLEYENTKRAPDTKKILEIFKDYEIESMLRDKNLVLNLEMFRHKFVQIAKLFGVVEKKATVTKSIVARLINFYRDSLIFDETIRDLTKNYFDLESVRTLQERIRKKEVEIVVYKSFGSSIANELLRSAYFYRELIAPLIPSSAEVEQFSEGLMNKYADLICTFCGFRFSRKLSELKEDQRIVCPYCKSPMVAVYSEGYEEVLEKSRKGGRLKRTEEKVREEALSSASMVDAYGLRALLALATYGVGIKTAARVLRMLRKDPKFFLVDLINAQKQFIKNRKYWTD